MTGNEGLVMVREFIRTRKAKYKAVSKLLQTVVFHLDELQAKMSAGDNQDSDPQPMIKRSSNADIRNRIDFIAEICPLVRRMGEYNRRIFDVHLAVLDILISDAELDPNKPMPLLGWGGTLLEALAKADDALTTAYFKAVESCLGRYGIPLELPSPCAVFAGD